MCESKEKGFAVKRRSFFTGPVKGIALLCLFPLLLLGCHYRGPGDEASAEKKILLNRIAVVPFQHIAPDHEAGGAVRCPLCGVTTNAVRAPGNPERILETLFLEELNRNKPTFHVLDGERVAAVYRRISAHSLTAPLNQVLREVGRELGADGVVTGFVYRFRERRGVAYSVEQPASVTFEIHLLQVSDGALVWRGTFDKTQSSLMEDLFQISSFYRGKGRWMTAKELMEEGVEQIIPTFPGLP